MRFFVIKAKHLLLGLIAFTVITTLFVSTKNLPVFLVGNREIPIYSVKRDDNKIALTFNCAWSDDDIENILKTLDAYGVKCTFFIVGDWAMKYPESVKLISDHGHEIANHSYSHSHMMKWSKDKILEDIEKCDALLESITQKKPMLFRAGYGEYNDNMIKACDETGRFYIQWSVDSIDYGDATGNDILNRVINKTKSGDIILMHSGTDNTAKVLPEIISKLSENYTLTTVSDLIYKENYTIDSSGKQIKS